MDPRFQRFLDEKRQQNAFLRQNGAVAAANRGDELLNELETLLGVEPEYTVEEASRLTGMHPESIRRRVRKGTLGKQAGKKHAIRIRASELPALVARAKPPATLPSSGYDADAHADHLLAKLGTR